MKDKKLINELNNSNYSSELKKYLSDLVNLNFSPFHDLDILNKIELDKLEYEIIKYNLISKSIKALEGTNNLTTSTKENFRIKANLIQKYNLINILFLSHINIDVYDRSNIESIYNSVYLEITDLKNKLNECGNYGYSSSEIKIIQKLKNLESNLEELSLIMRDKEIASYDRILLEELEIPKRKGILVGLGNIYETCEIYSNKKILVYKDTLYKQKDMY